MSFVAVAVGVGTAATGMIGSSMAAGAQKDAANQANWYQQQQYNQTRADQEPWRKAGGSAVTTLGGMVQPGGALWDNFDATKFQADPGYQFRLAEGAKALQNSAAAKGGVLGGGTLKDLTAYNSGMASQEYQNAYNRFQQDRTTRYNQLAGVAGLGLQSNNTMAQVGMNTANNMGNNAMYAGNARASGYVGIANGISQGIGGIYDIYQQHKQG